MKHKKIRLFITYLLVTFSLSLFAFTFSLTKYDVNLAHAKAMIKNKEYDVQIIKTNKGKETNSSYLLTTFNDKDLEKIDKLISVPYNKVLALSSNNQRLYITLGEEVENDTLYYEKNLSSEPNFIEYSNIDELNIIGNKPTNNNEILIHKILADYIIYYGVNIIELEDNKEVTKLYKPSSYEELINSNVHIKSADTYLIITGIIDDDMSKYDELKELKYIDIENNKDKLKLYKEFTIKSNEYLNNFIISSSFKDKTYLESNSMMNTTAFSTRILYNDKRYSLTSAVCLREGKPANVFTDKSEITIYDGVGTKEIS